MKVLVLKEGTCLPAPFLPRAETAKTLRRIRKSTTQKSGKRFMEALRFSQAVRPTLTAPGEGVGEEMRG